MRDHVPSAVRCSPAVPVLEGGLNLGLTVTSVLQVARLQAAKHPTQSKRNLSRIRAARADRHHDSGPPHRGSGGSTSSGSTAFPFSSTAKNTWVP